MSWSVDKNYYSDIRVYHVSFSSLHLIHIARLAASARKPAWTFCVHAVPSHKVHVNITACPQAFFLDSDNWGGGKYREYTFQIKNLTRLMRF